MRDLSIQNQAYRSCLQNVAEIDEIPFTEHVHKIDLPAAERAIYLELEHHLRALDMTVKRGRKSESDREKRLAQALGESEYVHITHKSFIEQAKARAQHRRGSPPQTLLSF